MSALSLLETVARHESALTSQVAEARETARGIVEKAHIEARTEMQEETIRLEHEIAVLRREAAEGRGEEARAIREAADQKVADARRAAGQKIPEVMREILGRILPKT